MYYDISYYTIHIKTLSTTPDKIGMQWHREKDELYLSPNGRLSYTKSAYIETKELADKFIELYNDRLVKRYGANTLVEAHKNTTSGTEKQIQKIQEQIKKDSKIIKARINNKILASNINPT